MMTLAEKLLALKAVKPFDLLRSEELLTIATAIAKGAGAASTYPLVAALVTLFLLFEAFLEFFHELVPAHLFQLGALLGREVLLHHGLEPVFGNVGFKPGNRLHALEVFTEGLVEFVVVRFVLDQAGAGEEVEVVNRVTDHAGLHGFQQGQVLPCRHGQFLGLEVEEEVDQHGEDLAVVAGHEYQSLEQMHILLVLEQRAVQRWH